MRMMLGSRMTLMVFETEMLEIPGDVVQAADVRARVEGMRRRIENKAYALAAATGGEMVNVSFSEHLISGDIEE
jgi:hypothetical protein